MLAKKNIILRKMTDSSIPGFLFLLNIGSLLPGLMFSKKEACGLIMEL